MRTVGIRELKNKLSKYLRAVREGETIAVTDRGAVIAQIGPPAEAREEGFPPGLLELQRRGLIRQLAWNDPSRYGRSPAALKEGTAAELLDWLRGDR